MATKPVMEIRKNGIKISFWENETNEGKRFYSIKVIKSYYDEKKQEWVDTEYFSEYDLPLLAILVQKASLELIQVKSTKEGKSSENMKNPMVELVTGQLTRIIGNGADKKEFKDNYLKEVMKKLSIEKEWKVLDSGEMAQIYSYLLNEKELNGGNENAPF